MYMEALNTAVGPLVEEGYIGLWTDGAKEVRLGIHVAGAGVFYGQGDSRNLSEPLPYGEQTNNRAELWAFIQSLRRAHPPRKITHYLRTKLRRQGNCVMVSGVASTGLEVKGQADSKC